ncbi:MAG: hypothetical protein HUJ54_06835 [Erysipelotrichaceae bacterium]|nr:hypothetical protein [Erysipelotrichaceae bacterium]
MKNKKTIHKFAAAALSAALMTPCFVPAVFAAPLPTNYRTADSSEKTAHNSNTLKIVNKVLKQSPLMASYFTINGIKEDGSSYVHTGVLDEDGTAFVEIPAEVNRDRLLITVGYIIIERSDCPEWIQCAFAEINGEKAIEADIYWANDRSVFFQILADDEFAAINRVRVERVSSPDQIHWKTPENVVPMELTPR